MPAEAVAIEAAHGRTLAEPLAALLTQPPFDASAMDGYAVRAADVARLPATLALIGEAAAGHPFAGSDRRRPGRAHLHRRAAAGRRRCHRHPGGRRRATATGQVTVREGTPDPGHVRHTGVDFRAGEVLLGRRPAPRARARCRSPPPWATARCRCAAARASPSSRPATSWCRPAAGRARARSSPPTTWAWRRSREAAGAEAQLLGIARDTRESLEAHFAQAADADVIVTIGGASVGDHDLVGPVLEARGMTLSFWKIAMRPGKPLMFGRLGAARVLGLPGNPVSSLVCTRVFLVPLLRALLGQPARRRCARCRPAPAWRSRPTARASTTCAPPPRPAPTACAVVTPVRSQDSSLLAPLAAGRLPAGAPVRAAAAPAGSLVPILPLDF